MSNYICANNFKRRSEIKPKVNFGDDKSFLNITRICNKALRRFPNAYNEMNERIIAKGRYNKVLEIVQEYVEITE